MVESGCEMVGCGWVEVGVRVRCGRRERSLVGESGGGATNKLAAH